MDKDFRVIKTEKELKVFNDPYRMKIIRTYQQSDDPLTVKGCADIMGEVPANVHYHVKKLLDIEILVLDHIEIINGINAKFYKLPKKSFTISLKGAEDEPTLSHLTHVHTIISNVIEDFKDNFMKSSAKAAENKSEELHETGLIASNHIKLTKEEFNEVSEYLTKLSKKYKNDKPGKKKYTFIGGLSRVLDKDEK